MSSSVVDVFNGLDSTSNMNINPFLVIEQEEDYELVELFNKLTSQDVSGELA